MLTYVQDLALRASKRAFSFCAFAVLRAVRFWSVTKAPKCSPNTDNNKSREKLILIHLWITKWISYSCKILGVGGGVA